MNIAVVIPVYKTPNEWEMISLQRYCEVMGGYHTILVAPESFEIVTYTSLWDAHGLKLYDERFDDRYFADIAGYNRLLLSNEFYIRFHDFDYILIYQPDAYVFRDELRDWCQRGYDYIGAPLVGKFEEKEYYSGMLIRVGNGGFSLRRVQAYLDYFAGKRNVFSSKQIAQRVDLWKKPYTRIFIWLLMMLGWKNKPLSVAANWRYNEDDFWSAVLDDSNYALSKPSPIEALSFAFERFPKELYEITKQIPFGCHAWKKYQFEEFWKQYIKQSNKD